MTSRRAPGEFDFSKEIFLRHSKSCCFEHTRCTWASRRAPWGRPGSRSGNSSSAPRISSPRSGPDTSCNPFRIQSSCSDSYICGCFKIFKFTVYKSISNAMRYANDRTCEYLLKWDIILLRMLLVLHSTHVCNLFNLFSSLELCNESLKE